MSNREVEVFPDGCQNLHWLIPVRNPSRCRLPSPNTRQHGCSLRLISCWEIRQRLPSCSGGSAGLHSVLIIWGMSSEFLTASSWEHKAHFDDFHSVGGLCCRWFILIKVQAFKDNNYTECCSDVSAERSSCRSSVLMEDNWPVQTVPDWKWLLLLGFFSFSWRCEVENLREWVSTM